MNLRKYDEVSGKELVFSPFTELSVQGNEHDKIKIKYIVKIKKMWYYIKAV